MQIFATKPKTENVAEVYENYIMLVQQYKQLAPQISLKGIKNVNYRNGKCHIHFDFTSLSLRTRHSFLLYDALRCAGKPSRQQRMI